MPRAGSAGRWPPSATWPAASRPPSWSSPASRTSTRRSRRSLTRPIVDRIENDPAPILLKATREDAEVVAIVAQRLRSLYDAHGAPFRDDDPTFPFPPAVPATLAGMRTRDVLDWCQEYRERCIAAGRLVALDGAARSSAADATSEVAGRHDPSRTGLERLPHAPSRRVPADDETGGAPGLGDPACSDEVEAGHRFAAEADGRMVPVECHAADKAVSRILVGVCNANAQGGRLGRQVAEVVERAGEHTARPRPLDRVPEQPQDRRSRSRSAS